MAGAEQQTNITIGANAQPYVDSLKQAQAATTSFGQSLDQLTASSNKIISEVTITAQGFARLRSSLDPAVKSAEQYAAASSKINAAVNVLNVSQVQANQLLDLANQKYKTVEYQAQQTAKAQQALAAAADKQTQADLAKQITAQAKAYDAQLAALYPLIAKQKELAEFQKNVNFAVSNSQISPQEGATQVADFQTKQNAAEAKKAAADVQAAMDAQTKAVNEATAAYDNFRASIDPVVAAQQKLAEEQQAAAKYQQQLNVLVNAGRISSIGAIGSMQQFRQAQEDAGNEGKKFNGTLGISSYQLLVIGQQFRQLLDQVIAGGGFFRPLAMQAPVVIENLNGVGNSLKLLKNNLGLIAGVAGVGLAVGALVALGISAESNQRSINSLANGLQKFGGDFQGNANLINAAAKTMAETTVLGTQEARDAMAQLASAPGFAMTRANLIATTNAVKDMAASMGISTQEAAKFVTNIFADPVAAAIDGVNKDVAGFTNNFVAHIKDLVNQGKQADAINEVFNKFADATKNAGNNLTPLQTAMKNLSEAFTAVGNSATGSGKSIGTALTDALAGVINDVTSCVKFLGQMSAAFTQMGVSGKTQLEIVGGLLTLQILPGVRNVEAALVKMAAVQFASLIGGLNGVAAAANTVGMSLTRNPAILALVTAMTAYQMIAGQQKDLVDEDAIGAQLGIKKQPGGVFGLTPTYTDETGKSISHDELLSRVAGFVQTPAMQYPANVPPAATNLVSTAQGFTGQTGAALNTWLNANGAQIDAAKNAWCAAFVNSALASVGIAGTGSNLASSFLNFSEERKGPAQKGDIIVQPPQAEGTSGHVGIFTGNVKVAPDGKTYLEMTSGNEGGKVQTNFVSQSNISSIRALPSATKNPADDTANQKAADKALLNLPNSLPVQQAQLATQIKASQDLIAGGTLSGDALDKEQQKVRDLTGQLYKLVDPVTQITRTQKDQLAVTNELDPAQQKLIEIGQQYDEMMKSRGEAPDPAQRLQLQKQALDELAAGYRQITSAGEVQAASQERVAAAWEQGTAAAQHQANAEAARQAIAGNAPTISLQMSAAIDKETASKDRNTASTLKQQMAQQKLQDQSQMRLLNVEQSTAGLSASQQATQLAAAQREEQLLSQGADLQSADAQASISSARRVAQRQLEVAQTKAAWQDIAQVGGQAIDDLGQGLMTVLETGKWTDFGNVAKKVLQDISTEFLKLALLNPLKNLLLPGSNAPTLFDLFNNAGGQTTGNLAGNLPGVAGGTSGSGFSGFNPSGLLGGLAGAFGKTGIFGSEGLLANGFSGISNLFSGLTASGFATGSNLANLTTQAALNVAGGAAGLHGGGLVGGVGGTEHFMPMSVFSHAPRLHSGGMTPMSSLPVFGNDEVPAILQRNEMVLTKQQQKSISAKLNGNNRPIVITPTINVNTPDADSFRKSKNQIASEMARTLSTAARNM